MARLKLLSSRALWDPLIAREGDSSEELRVRVNHMVPETLGRGDRAVGAPCGAPRPGRGRAGRGERGGTQPTPSRSQSRKPAQDQSKLNRNI
jgi:hypothetical protein